MIRGRKFSLCFFLILGKISEYFFIFCSKFCNTAKEIFIYSESDAKIGNEDNKFAEGGPMLTTTILPPDVNNN